MRCATAARGQTTWCVHTHAHRHWRTPHLGTGQISGSTEKKAETCVTEQDTTAGNTDQGRVKSFCLLGVSTVKQPALLGKFLSKYGNVSRSVDRHMARFELQITESRSAVLLFSGGFVKPHTSRHSKAWLGFLTGTHSPNSIPNKNEHVRRKREPLSTGSNSSEWAPVTSACWKRQVRTDSEQRLQDGGKAPRFLPRVGIGRK